MNHRSGGGIGRLAVIGLGLAAWGAGEARAQPVLSSSVTNWGRVSIYGPEITSSGGARTELFDVVDRWDHNSDGDYTFPQDGRLEQNVWTEAALVNGTPTFRSYHDLNGHGIPLHGGNGWTGFATAATYQDSWTFFTPLVPLGAPVQVQLTFGLHATISHLWGPGGSVQVPPNFYPYNPLWGSTGGSVVIVNPLPEPPRMGMFLEFGNYSWYGAASVPGLGHQAVTFGPAGFFPALTLENGRAYDLSLRFDGGWFMAHRDVRASIGEEHEQFSTNVSWDGSHTAQLSGVRLFSLDGTELTGVTITDSLGAAIIPVAAVPEPATSALLAAGAVLAGAVWRRRRAA